MGGVFESTIKMIDGSHEDWYIELKDISDNVIEICKDLSEYQTKIEELGLKYDNVINEVRWSKTDNVPPYVMDVIRFEMSKLQREIEEESGEPLINK